MKRVLLRRDQEAVSPVIGTILMVAITVVLAAVLYVMVTGLVGPLQGQKPNLVMAAGSWSGGSIVISFVSISNAPNLDPTDLTYLVSSADGATYFSGPAGTVSAVSNVSVTILYQDNANSGKVTNEDTIRMSVSPSTTRAIRGGSFNIYTAGDLIGFISHLP